MPSDTFLPCKSPLASPNAHTPPRSPSPSPKRTSHMRLVASRPAGDDGRGRESATPGATPKEAAEQESQRKHLWVITGPAGCGKSTVAAYLANALDLPFVEGDEHHPTSNIAKMSEGIPLTDADRWDWLTALRKLCISTLTNTTASGVVLTCSCLKEKYRDVLRLATYNAPDVLVHFVYLRADESVLLERTRARQGHFMKDDMVRSQLADLEEPTGEELTEDCLIVDVSGQPPVVMEKALEAVENVLKLPVVDGVKGEA